MSRVRVSKQFTIDMAHALHGYDGPCKNIHGHTYHLTVTIRGRIIEDAEDVKLGMVLDFTDLKRIVNELIVSRYDHALVLNGNALEHITLKQKAEKEFGSIILLDKQPTCENLLITFKDLLLPHYHQEEMKLVYIKLQETPNSYAEWFIEDEQ
jgi:6-pyruvoyltetrahydropterin/6-carboxytetrahydropterin synthase